MKKALVVEDQTVMRDLICRLLESFPGFKVVGSSGDGQEAYDLCIKLKPDLVILDMLLPSLHGIDILEKLKKKGGTSPRILVFSAIPSSGIVNQAIKLGVEGIIEKNAELKELRIAIEKVTSGQTYFSSTIIETMREAMISGTTNKTLEALSMREREIIKLIAESYSNKEVADKLGISLKTVESHRSKFMKKLNIHDTAGITRFAISSGLTEADTLL